jgi:hypothetical protein
MLTGHLQPRRNWPIWASWAQLGRMRNGQKYHLWIPIFLNDFCGFFKTVVFSENIKGFVTHFKLNMEELRSSKNMVIIFIKKICIKSNTVINILAFSIYEYIPASTVLPFLEAPLVALFWYECAACCHILLNISYTHKAMAFKPNLKNLRYSQ